MQSKELEEKFKMWEEPHADVTVSTRGYLEGFLEEEEGAFVLNSKTNDNLAGGCRVWIGWGGGQTFEIGGVRSTVAQAYVRAIGNLVEFHPPGVGGDLL